MNAQVSVYTADSTEEKFFKNISQGMQTPITGDTSAFSALHFHLKEHSVDCAKKKESRTKNTEYCRLHSESVFGETAN